MESNLTLCLLLPVYRRLFCTALLELCQKWNVYFTDVTEMVSSKIWCYWKKEEMNWKC